MSQNQHNPLNPENNSNASASTRTTPDDPENITYDDIQARMAAVTDQKEEEEKDRIKKKEEEEAKRMARITRVKEKDPPLSCAWSIGDAPCFMWALQFIVFCACAISLCITYLQTQITYDVACVKNDAYYGPFQVTKEDGTSYGCPWPLINVISRSIAPLAGAVLSLCILIFTTFCGRTLYKNIASYNNRHYPSEEENGIEYYEIYNTLYFRGVKVIIGICAQWHFISFGLDAAQYIVGHHYSQTNDTLNGVTSYKGDFRVPLVIALPVAMLLRLMHNSIYIPLKKKNVECQCGVHTGTTYTTTTHEKVETTIGINPNATTVDGKESKPSLYVTSHPASVVSGASGSHYAHVMSAPSIVNGGYAPSIVSGGYAPSVVGDHTKTHTVIYVDSAKAPSVVNQYHP